MTPTIGLAAKTEYTDKALTVSLVLLGEGATCAPGEAYHPFGFQGRPKSPDVDPVSSDVTNGARVLYWFEGSTLHGVVLDDPRRSNELPELEEGGSLWYADASGAWSRYRADGTLEVRAPAGKTITVQVGSGALVEVSDGTVKVGGQAAVPLAKASVVADLITALKSAATTLSGSADPGAASAGSALTLALGKLADPATTKALGE